MIAQLGLEDVAVAIEQASAVLDLLVPHLDEGDDVIALNGIEAVRVLMGRAATALNAVESGLVKS